MGTQQQQWWRKLSIMATSVPYSAISFFISWIKRLLWACSVTLVDCECLMSGFHWFVDQHKSIYYNLQYLCVDRSPAGTVKGLHQNVMEIWIGSLKLCVCICSHVCLSVFHVSVSVGRAAHPTDMSHVWRQTFYLCQTLHYGFSQVLLTANLLYPRLSACFGYL